MLWRQRQWSAVVLAVISIPVAEGIAKLAGLFYSHIQPFAAGGYTPLVPHAIDNSFPSDHVVIAATIASVVFVYNRRAGLILWVMALCVGAARVAAGLHYPLDIAVSAVIAVAVVFCVSKVLSRFIQQ